MSKHHQTVYYESVLVFHNTRIDAALAQSLADRIQGQSRLLARLRAEVAMFEAMPVDGPAVSSHTMCI